MSTSTNRSSAVFISTKWHFDFKLNLLSVLKDIDDSLFYMILLATWSANTIQNKLLCYEIVIFIWSKIQINIQFFFFITTKKQFPFYLTSFHWLKLYVISSWVSCTNCAIVQYYTSNILFLLKHSNVDITTTIQSTTIWIKWRWE